MQFSYLFFFAASVLGHGIIISPPARAVGPAMISACGASVAALVTADNTSHVEGMPEAALKEKSFNPTVCNVFLCKGLQFQDNRDNVQTFRPGQVVNMRANIPIPHVGPMNVSIVNTKMNMQVGEPLITFTSYADESLPVLPLNNTNFDVTIPTNLGSACSIAGVCVSHRYIIQRFRSRADSGAGAAMVLVRHQGRANLRVVRGYGRSWRTLCQQRGNSTLEILRWIHKLIKIGRRMQRLQSVVSILDQLRQGLHPLLRSLRSQAALQASKLVEHILFCQ